MTIAVDPGAFDDGVSPSVAVRRAAVSRRLPGLATAAAMSIGAGAVHAAATGVHAEHPQLARIFVVTAVLQLGVGLLALARPSRAAALATAAVSVAAVAGWVTTRVAGISWIDGLEVSEAPQYADSACALLAAVAAGAALSAAPGGLADHSTCAPADARRHRRRVGDPGHGVWRHPGAQPFRRARGHRRRRSRPRRRRRRRRTACSRRRAARRRRRCGGNRRRPLARHDDRRRDRRSRRSTTATTRGPRPRRRRHRCGRGRGTLPTASTSRVSRASPPSKKRGP